MLAAIKAVVNRSNTHFETVLVKPDGLCYYTFNNAKSEVLANGCETH